MCPEARVSHTARPTTIKPAAPLSASVGIAKPTGVKAISAATATAHDQGSTPNTAPSHALPRDAHWLLWGYGQARTVFVCQLHASLTRVEGGEDGRLAARVHVDEGVATRPIHPYRGCRCPR